MTGGGGHCPTRIEVRVDWRGVHLVPACAHGNIGEALCGARSNSWLSDAGPQVHACPKCLRVYRTESLSLPCGPEHLLSLFGITEPLPPDPLVSCRRAIEGLEPLTPDDIGQVALLSVSKSEDGRFHADPWCAEHVGPPALHPVGINEDGSLRMESPLHCQRGLPEEVETALYHAVQTHGDRERLRMLGTLSPWDLYGMVHNATERGDLTFEHISREIGEPIPERLLFKHGTNRLLYDTLVQVLEGWGGSDWARWETNKRVGYALAAHRALPTSLAQLCVSHVHSGDAMMMLEPARVMEGGRIPVSEASLILTRFMESEGCEPHAIEDAVDVLVTFDRTIGHLSHQMLSRCTGLIIDMEGPIPAEWTVWPHRSLDDGSSQCWLPEPLAQSLAGVTVSEFFWPMAEGDARSLLVSP